MDSENKPTSQGSSVGSLLSTVMHEISSLVRNEAELAKTEMSEKTHQAMEGIASIAIAGAVLLGGFLTLLAAAGQKKLQVRNLMPNRTMNSLQSDKAFAQKHQHNVKEELK